MNWDTSTKWNNIYQSNKWTIDSPIHTHKPQMCDTKSKKSYLKTAW